MPRRKPKENSVLTAEAEILDEEFENYVRVANSLVPKLKIPNGNLVSLTFNYIHVAIAEKTILKCKKLHAKPNNKVKKWVQDYFKLFLKALFWTSKNQHKIYKKWYPNNSLAEAKTWLTKNKSFMAMKKLDNGAFIVYIALANNACSGWQEQGLKSLMEDCTLSGM